MPTPLPQFDVWMTSTSLGSFHRRERELILVDEFLKAYLQYRAKPALDGLDRAIQDYRRAVPNWRNGNRNRGGMMTRTFVAVSELVAPGLERQSYIWSPYHPTDGRGRDEEESKDRAVHEAFTEMSAGLGLYPHWQGGDSPTDLRKFSPNATLYILAHGHSQMPVFTIAKKQWTADQLAARLVKDGLRIDQNNIVMLVCHAGESVNTKAAGEALWKLQQKNNALKAALNAIPETDVRTRARIEAQKAVVAERFGAVLEGPHHQHATLYESARNQADLLLPMAAQLSAAFKIRGFDNFMLTSYKAPVRTMLVNGSICLDLRSVSTDARLAHITNGKDYVPVERVPDWVARWR